MSGSSARTPIFPAPIQLLPRSFRLRSIQLSGRKFPPAGLPGIPWNESTGGRRWIDSRRITGTHQSGGLRGCLPLDTQRRPAPLQQQPRRQTGERIERDVVESEQLSKIRPE